MSQKELEAKLDSVFSEYIRRTSTLGQENPVARCATCGKPAHWKDLDCGHYVSRVFRATRWDEKNVAPQCCRCNSFLGGCQHKMREHLVGKHGEEAIEDVEARANRGGERRHNRLWLIEKITEYRAALKKAIEEGWGE